ncbi:MAG: hypothetical protein AAF961_11280 [Planctomycetota bacterium]
MPIRVTCPGCHTRFMVGDEHAGKTGACPKCKAPIEIPKPEDEVVIHAPVHEAGAVDSKGRSVLKPIKRKEAKFQLNSALVVGGLALLGVAIAFLAGRNDLTADQIWWVLAVGSVLLGPPLAYAGYSFLRDDELDAYRGVDVLLRSLGCGAVYALMWGMYVYLGNQVVGDDALNVDGLEVYQLAILAGAAILIGAGAALVCFDLDYLTGVFHFALYFGVCLLLRVVMGLPLLPGMASGV